MDGPELYEMRRTSEHSLPLQPGVVAVDDEGVIDMIVRARPTEAIATTLTNRPWNPQAGTAETRSRPTGSST